MLLHANYIVFFVDLKPVVEFHSTVQFTNYILHSYCAIVMADNEKTIAKDDNLISADRKHSAPNVTPLSTDTDTHPTHQAAASESSISTRKQTSFQITSVTCKGSRLSTDGGEDSADDLDESHAEDTSSDILDCSRTTDADPEVISEEPSAFDGVFNRVSEPGISERSHVSFAENVAAKTATKLDSPLKLEPSPPLEQLQHRFRVVKIFSSEPFKRGRWLCMDFLDPPAPIVEAKPESSISNAVQMMTEGPCLTDSKPANRVAHIYEIAPTNVCSGNNSAGPLNDQPMYGIFLPINNIQYPLINGMYSKVTPELVRQLLQSQNITPQSSAEGSSNSNVEEPKKEANYALAEPLHQASMIPIGQFFQQTQRVHMPEATKSESSPCESVLPNNAQIDKWSSAQESPVVQQQTQAVQSLPNEPFASNTECIDNDKDKIKLPVVGNIASTNTDAQIESSRSPQPIFLETNAPAVVQSHTAVPGNSIHISSLSPNMVCEQIVSSSELNAPALGNQNANILQGGVINVQEPIPIVSTIAVSSATAVIQAPPHDSAISNLQLAGLPSNLSTVSCSEANVSGVLQDSDVHKFKSEVISQAYPATNTSSNNSEIVSATTDIRDSTNLPGSPLQNRSFEPIKRDSQPNIASAFENAQLVTVPPTQQWGTPTKTTTSNPEISGAAVPGVQTIVGQIAGNAISIGNSGREISDRITLISSGSLSENPVSVGTIVVNTVPASYQPSNISENQALLMNPSGGQVHMDSKRGNLTNTIDLLIVNNQSLSSGPVNQTTINSNTKENLTHVVNNPVNQVHKTNIAEIQGFASNTIASTSHALMDNTNVSPVALSNKAASQVPMADASPNIVPVVSQAFVSSSSIGSTVNQASMVNSAMSQVPAGNAVANPISLINSTVCSMSVNQVLAGTTALHEAPLANTAVGQISMVNAAMSSTIAANQVLVENAAVSQGNLNSASLNQVSVANTSLNEVFLTNTVTSQGPVLNALPATTVVNQIQVETATINPIPAGNQSVADGVSSQASRTEILTTVTEATISDSPALVSTEEDVSVSQESVSLPSQTVQNHIDGKEAGTPPASQDSQQDPSSKSDVNGEDQDNVSSGTSTVAIDNKIEQAMDLVKSHLMFAVREEVDVLKEKITELMDKISQLENENIYLRANASSETLEQLSLTQPLQQQQNIPILNFTSLPSSNVSAQQVNMHNQQPTS